MKSNFLFTLLTFVCLSLALTSCQKDAEGDASNETTADAKTEVSKVTPAAKQNPNADATAAAVPAGPSTTWEFESYEFDFGEITSGDKVQHVYKFTNTGKEPLVISNAKGTCGCTVPDWPKDPIAPGEAGEILVEFRSKGKSGQQTKRVIITANTNPTTTNLTIKGKVNKVDQPAASNG